MQEGEPGVLINANAGLATLKSEIEDCLREHWRCEAGCRSPTQLFAGDQEFIFGGIHCEEHEEIGIFVRWQNSSAQ